MEPRQSFRFYRSFYEAIKKLPKKERLAVYEAIADYSLNGTTPNLTGTADAVFTLIKPNLDASNRKADSGKAGGMAPKNGKQSESKPKANGKQSESKPKANGKQSESTPEPTRVFKEGEEEGEIGRGGKEGEGDSSSASASAAATAVFAYRDKINPTPSETCIAELEGFAETMGAECCLRAFDIALDAKAANWHYVRAILRDKQASGVRCLADWDALERKRSGTKNSPQTGFYDYSNKEGSL